MSAWHGPKEPTRDRGFAVRHPESRPPKESWWDCPREDWQARVDKENTERIRNSREAYSAPLNGQPRA